jgi:hypothetical protein
MEEFNIGDRVRRGRPDYNHHLVPYGSTGTISRLGTTKVSVDVRWDHLEAPSAWRCSSLELISQQDHAAQLLTLFKS